MKHHSRKKVSKGYSFRLDCENKRAFATEDEAQRAAEYQMLQFMELNLVVYQCHICGHWHLTRQTHQEQ